MRVVHKGAGPSDACGVHRVRAHGACENVYRLLKRRQGFRMQRVACVRGGIRRQLGAADFQAGWLAAGEGQFLYDMCRRGSMEGKAVSDRSPPPSSPMTFRCVLTKTLCNGINSFETPALWRG